MTYCYKCKHCKIRSYNREEKIYLCEHESKEIINYVTGEVTMVLGDCYELNKSGRCGFYE